MKQTKLNQTTLLQHAFTAVSAADLPDSDGDPMIASMRRIASMGLRRLSRAPCSNATLLFDLF
jgi:hypothetical protein